MRQPQGFERDPTLVYKINKSLYGLKQAPREWNERFDIFVKSLNFVQSKHDKCLYVFKDKEALVYLLLYVDDIIITGNSDYLINKFKSALMSEFKTKDLGPLKCFLGIKIDRNVKGMFLSQPIYVDKLLQKFGMENCHPIKTPMENNPTKDLEGRCIIEEKPYRELIGCLMHLMLTSRPDISAAVNFYSRYQSNATLAQWNGLKRVLRYLKGTADYGLFYAKNQEKNNPLVAYADSDWAGDTDRKSTSGFMFEVFDADVCWVTRKQTIIAASSTEAEYVSLATASAELIWIKNILMDLCIDINDPIIIYEDNQSCSYSLSKWDQKRLKHIDVKYHFVKDLHQKHIIDVVYIPFQQQKADILTKGLPAERYAKLRQTLGVMSYMQYKIINFISTE